MTGPSAGHAPAQPPAQPPTRTGSQPEATARDRRLGLIYGVVMALGAALSFAIARRGILMGFGPEDLTLLRFAGAGLAFLPMVLKAGIGNLAGIGWRRGLMLTLLAGPAFSMLQNGGYVFAPLAHGAVLVPMSVTVFSGLMAVVILRERLGRAHVIGTAIVLAGITLLAAEGLQVVHGSDRVWIGDLLFISAGAMWAVYTILLRHWRVDAVAAAAVVAILSLVATVPLYVLLFPVDKLWHLPIGEVAIQALSQGLLSGVIALVCYSRTVNLLGAGRAVLFPAMVPGLAIVFGIPLLGEWPTWIQLAGLAVASAGFAVALGLLKRR